MQQAVFLADEAASVAMGQRLASLITAPLVMSFDGQIGAGKTTIVRALIRDLGIKGAIKSPTFSIVEEYPCQNFSLYHFDCYRITEPDELDYIGFRDYFSEDSVCLIEWPKLAGGYLPNVDLGFELKLQHNGRQLVMLANTTSGERLLQGLI